jgi:flagellar protein FlgJ
MIQPHTPNDLRQASPSTPRAWASLKQSAKAGSPEALKGAATQFEAMFINMMMKSMRDATPQDGMLDNQQTKMFTTMLDQQMSQNMAKRGVGLADMLIRQLSKSRGQALAIGGEGSAAASNAPRRTWAPMPPLQRSIALPAAAPPRRAPPRTTSAAAGQQGAQAPHVRVPGQAGRPRRAPAGDRHSGQVHAGPGRAGDGWGKREIKGNATAATATTCSASRPAAAGRARSPGHHHRIRQRQGRSTKVEKFRAYDSYADSFKDYAKLITNNPRYEKVLASAGDATGRLRARPAEGRLRHRPDYATKLSSASSSNLA